MHIGRISQLCQMDGCTVKLKGDCFLEIIYSTTYLFWKHNWFANTSIINNELKWRNCDDCIHEVLYKHCYVVHDEKSIFFQQNFLFKYHLALYHIDFISLLRCNIQNFTFLPQFWTLVTLRSWTSIFSWRPPSWRYGPASQTAVRSSEWDRTLQMPSDQLNSLWVWIKFWVSWILVRFKRAISSRQNI